MNYRNYKFLARTAALTNGVLVHDINMQDPISEIIIGMDVTNSAQDQTAHPVAAITKIELVDGSDVLFSLDGYEAEALDWYNNGGQFRSNYNIALNGSNMCRFIGIHFGRYLWDPEYAFDPKQFNNPQLRISYNSALGANAGSAVYFTMWANMFDEAVPAVKGFLMTKEIKQYTMANNTHEYTDMPLDHPYRSIYFRPFLQGTEPGQAVKNIKLTEDQDKKVPFNLGGADLLRTLCAQYPAVDETYYFMINAAATRYLYHAATARVTGVAAEWRLGAPTRYYGLFAGDGGRTACRANGTVNSQVHIKGYVPHCVYELSCGVKSDPATYYDVTRLGSLKLDIEGEAAAQGYIFVEQVRNY